MNEPVTFDVSKLMGSRRIQIVAGGTVLADLPDDLDPVRYGRVTRVLDAWNAAIRGETADFDAERLYAVTAEVCGRELAEVRAWGSVLCIEALDFLFGYWAAQMSMARNRCVELFPSPLPTEGR